jgi:hypothetical protein
VIWNNVIFGRVALAGLIPKPGWYITNDLYYYSGDTDQEIPIAGLLNQGDHARS